MSMSLKQHNNAIQFIANIVKNLVALLQICASLYSINWPLITSGSSSDLYVYFQSDFYSVCQAFFLLNRKDRRHSSWQSAAIEMSFCSVDNSVACVTNVSFGHAVFSDLSSHPVYNFSIPRNFIGPSTQQLKRIY